MTLAGPWRRVLVDDPTNARPIVPSLLIGRVTFTPKPAAEKRWILSGAGSLAGLFERTIFPLVVRPQRDSNQIWTEFRRSACAEPTRLPSV
jgi:hypothetical protein